MKKFIITAFIFLSIVPSYAIDSQNLEAIILSIMKNEIKDKNGGAIKKDKKEIKSAYIPKKKGRKEPKTKVNNEESTPLTPDRILFETGTRLFYTRFFESALKNLKKLKNIYTESPYRDNARIWCARIYLKLGKSNDALKELNDIGEDSGEYPSALYYIGKIENNNSRSSIAIEYFSRISSQFPSHYLADDALISLGDILIKENKGNQALEALMKIIKEYPDKETIDDAYFLIGKVFEKDPVLKDYEIAWQIYNLFLKKAGEKRFPNFWNSPLKESVIRDLHQVESIYFRH